MPSLLRSQIDDLVRVMSDEPEQFQRANGRVMAAARESTPAELTAAVEALAPVVQIAGGLYSKVGLLAGTLVEWGGSPLALCDPLPRRAAASMAMYGLFPGVWAAATGGEPLPDRTDLNAIAPTRNRVVAWAEAAGRPADRAGFIAWSWFDVTDWAMPLIPAMAHREFRAAMVHRDWVRDEARALAGQLEAVDCVLGLTLVLDDEPLVVLDHASGRGFRLTMSGIGDNFQLHTLLAGRLHGHVPGLEPPDRAWVAAATDGEPSRPVNDGIYRRFRLFDGHGGYVQPEGRPADIQPLDGTRVLVLHPPLAPFGWTCGRFYPLMVPTLTLDRVMDPAESRSWLDRIAPAIQTDIMALGRIPPPA